LQRSRRRLPASWRRWKRAHDASNRLLRLQKRDARSASRRAWAEARAAAAVAAAAVAVRAVAVVAVELVPSSFLPLLNHLLIRARHISPRPRTNLTLRLGLF
jgi:hypothetical protein